MYRPQGALYFRSRRVRCPPTPCKDCVAEVDATQALQTTDGAHKAVARPVPLSGHIFAYVCTSIGPAIGAAASVCIGDSIREIVGCQHTSAVAIAAICSTIAQIIATTIAATAIGAFGDSWRASVTPGLGFGDYGALGSDTSKLVRKQATKAGFKSFASRVLVAMVGSELGLLGTIACALLTAVTGGVLAAVSIEAAQARCWSSRTAAVTAYKATYKTAIKTAISTSLKEALRRVGTAGPLFGPVFTTALCCGTGIGLRNWIVDELQKERPSGAASPVRRGSSSACPHRYMSSSKRRARMCRACS